MNSIFVVTENLIGKGRAARTIINQPFIVKAFRTKRQAFDLIEQFYYADIETIKKYSCFNISNVYIGNDVVRIQVSRAIYGGFTIQVLFEYRIEEIPFE